MDNFSEHKNIINENGTVNNFDNANASNDYDSTANTNELNVVNISNSNVKEEMKVYFALSIGLFLTGLFGLLIPYFLYLGYPNNLDQQLNVASLMSMIAIVPLLISSICINVFAMPKPNRSKIFSTGMTTLFYVLLIISMSLILSPLVILFQNLGMANTLYLAFIGTSLSFVGIALLSRFTKLSFLVKMFIALGGGLMLLIGLNLIFNMTALISGNFNMLFFSGILIQGFLLIYMVVYAMLSFKGVQQRAAAGLYKNNAGLVIAEAATLYAAFINIFIRVLYFILIAMSSSRRN